jgi:signal transduction histidine kinase
VPEWSFQRKLITGVIVICLLTIATALGSLFASRLLISNLTQLAAGEGRDLADARAMQLVGNQNIADVHACLLTSGREFAPAARAGSAQLRVMASRLELRTTDPRDRALIDSVLAIESAHQRAFTHALNVSGPVRGIPSGLDLDPVLARGESLNDALDALVTHLDSAAVLRVASTRATADRAEVLLIVVTLVTVLLLVLLSLVLIGVLGKSYRRQMTATTLAEHGQTAARASLSEVEAASHLKDEFLATVSHELRNPLAPILTWTQLLRSGTLDKEKTRRALEVIERNVASQAQLIDDLVDVSRVVSGKFRLDVRPIDLAPVIRSAADSQGPASDAKHIRLQLVLDERAGLISGDSERLQQVMWNLLSNAIKFTPSGGSVSLSAALTSNGEMAIRVADSGIGIRAEDLPRVLQPFAQVINPESRRHEGTGLGLPLAKGLAELHGGGLVITSVEGVGTTVTVTLPLATEDEVSAVVAAAATP